MLTSSCTYFLRFTKTTAIDWFVKKRFIYDYLNLTQFELADFWAFIALNAYIN